MRPVSKDEACPGMYLHEANDWNFVKAVGNDKNFSIDLQLLMTKKEQMASACLKFLSSQEDTNMTTNHDENLLYRRFSKWPVVNFCQTTDG